MHAELCGKVTPTMITLSEVSNVLRSFVRGKAGLMWYTLGSRRLPRSKSYLQPFPPSPGARGMYHVLVRCLLSIVSTERLSSSRPRPKIKARDPRHSVCMRRATLACGRIQESIAAPWVDLPLRSLQALAPSRHTRRKERPRSPTLPGQPKYISYYVDG